MKIYRVVGEILSPVHIGTNKTWEPWEYFIDSSANKLHLFSTEDVLAKLDDSSKQAFYELVEQDNITALRNFIVARARETVGVSNGKGAISVTPAIAKLYDEKIDDIRNQLLIQPMICMASTGKAYLPGSSIKGAVRTAIVSALALQSGLPAPKPFGREVWEFESKVLKYRDAKADPFRAVKFADSYLADDATFICHVYNIGKDRDGVLKPTQIQLIHQVTHSLISAAAYQTRCRFETELRLDVELMRQGNAVSQRFTLEQIINCCRQFYLDKLNMEHTKFYEGSTLADYSDQLLRQTYAPDECLIRVGRFSGVESVTLDEYRNPQPPGRDKGWGNSRNVADGQFPMGWVKLKFINLK